MAGNFLIENLKTRDLYAIIDCGLTVENTIFHEEQGFPPNFNIYRAGSGLQNRLNVPAHGYINISQPIAKNNLIVQAFTGFSLNSDYIDKHPLDPGTLQTPMQLALICDKACQGGSTTVGSSQVNINPLIMEFYKFNGNSLHAQDVSLDFYQAINRYTRKKSFSVYYRQTTNPITNPPPLNV